MSQSSTLVISLAILSLSQFGHPYSISEAMSPSSLFSLRAIIRRGLMSRLARSFPIKGDWGGTLLPFLFKDTVEHIFKGVTGGLGDVLGLVGVIVEDGGWGFSCFWITVDESEWFGVSVGGEDGSVVVWCRREVAVSSGCGGGATACCVESSVRSSMRSLPQRLYPGKFLTVTARGGGKPQPQVVSGVASTIKHLGV